MRYEVFMFEFQEGNRPMPQNKASVFTLSNSSDLYILLSFRAKDLTHAEKIEIILELERSIKQATEKHIYLVWGDGRSESDLTIWSESSTEKIVPFNSISQFFGKCKFAQHQLPDYLYKKMDTHPQFIVFPDEPYILSMLDMPQRY